MTDALQWHLLGGNNESGVGGNSGLCVYTYKEDGKEKKRTLLFDAGVLMGDSQRPEDPALAQSDTVLANYGRFLYKTDDPSHKPETPIDSIFLTHNHDDHTGALPLLILMGYKLPKIYATPYTAKRLAQEFSNAGLDPAEWPKIFTIAPGKAIEEGPVKVTAFWVSHSTPQSVGFFIDTPEGTILNTGDFKLDPSVLWGPAFSEEQFRRVVNKPVDLLLLDSTGADSNTKPVTEVDMRETLHDVIAQNPGKRLVVAVMGGYEENLASIAKVAADEGRTLWIAGSAHEQALSALQDTGMTLSDHLGCDVDMRILGSPKSARELAAQKPDEGIVIVTGSQGHSNSALARAADGTHGSLKLNPAKDIILFCAPTMHGQVGLRERMISTLESKNFKIITHKDMPLYPSAHARLPEMVEMVKMADPKRVLPIHGSRRLRDACAEALKKMGRKVIGADNGDVLNISSRGVVSANPETKGKAPLIGLRTLQGSNWTERYYLQTEVPQEKPPEPKEPANKNKKHRPQFFKAKP